MEIGALICRPSLPICTSCPLTAYCKAYKKKDFAIITSNKVNKTKYFEAQVYKHNNKYPHLLTCINCPIWKEEVKKWRKDNSYELKIWDYPRKKMKLIKDN